MKIHTQEYIWMPRGMPQKFERMSCTARGLFWELAVQSKGSGRLSVEHISGLWFDEEDRSLGEPAIAEIVKSGYASYSGEDLALVAPPGTRWRAE